MAEVQSAEATPESGIHGVAAMLALVGALVLGFALGLTAPIIYVGIGAGLYAGFTMVGYVFLAASAAALLSAVAAAFPRARMPAAVVFLASSAIAGGTLIGNWAALRLGVPWAVGMAMSRPSYPQYPQAPYGTLRPFPVTLEAPGTVRLSLRDVSDVSATSPGPYDGGTFGHWCYSQPGGQGVAEIDVIDALRLRTDQVWLGLRLIAPSGPIGPSMAVPRVVLQVRTEAGQVDAHYAGVGTIVEGGGPTGRLTFEGLPNTESSTGWPRTLAGEISWSCQPWPAMPSPAS